MSEYLETNAHLRAELFEARQQIVELREALERIKATRIIPATIWGIAHKALSHQNDESALRECSDDPIYAFRRKGQFDFCTCSEYRYLECANMPKLFEVAIFFRRQQL